MNRIHRVALVMILAMAVTSSTTITTSAEPSPTTHIPACGAAIADWAGTPFVGYVDGPQNNRGEYRVTLHANLGAHVEIRNLVSNQTDAADFQGFELHSESSQTWIDYYYWWNSKRNIANLAAPVCEDNSSRVTAATLRLDESGPRTLDAPLRRTTLVCGSHIEDYVGQQFTGVHGVRPLEASFYGDRTMALTVDGVRHTNRVTIATQTIPTGGVVPADPNRDVAQLDWRLDNDGEHYITVNATCPEGRTEPRRLEGRVYEPDVAFTLIAPGATPRS